MLICSEEQYIIYLIESDLPLNRLILLVHRSSHFNILKAPSTSHENHKKNNYYKKYI